jgi:alpha-beta hydrolase superfamily lysophospholipase
MIHGVGGTGAVWETFSSTFAASGHACESPTLAANERRVIDPPPHLLEITLQDYVDEAMGWARAISANHGRRPVVIGHSMGGLIAQKLAEADLASAAVLVTPASPAEVVSRPTLSQIFTFANIIVSGEQQTKMYRIWRPGFRWGVLNRTPASRHAAIYSQVVQDSGRVYAALSGPPETPGRRAASIDAARVRVPVLTIGAAHDRATPAKHVRAVAAFYAAVGEYREYTDHGHWIIDEPGADKVATDIVRWMEANGGA